MKSWETGRSSVDATLTLRCDEAVAHLGDERIYQRYGCDLELSASVASYVIWETYKASRDAAEKIHAKTKKDKGNC